MTQRFRDFLHTLRNCKTAAEERAVVAKECALIRTSCKEDDNYYRTRNLAKLLYMHMMGYPCQFAQMECLKLIASPNFKEKRLGYLGLSQLLDENTELLMLATNSIKNDLRHSNQYVNGLALTALGNMGSAEVCRSLAREVEDLCSYGNPYVRKKAILCAMRLVRKVDDMAERFLPILPNIFAEKNHGILLAACSFLSLLVETQSGAVIDSFRDAILPLLLAAVRRVLVLSTYSKVSEYDIAGITDPFLQAKLLTAICQLYKPEKCTKVIEILDVLNQVAASTDAIKSAGNAVLLEFAKAILTMQLDSASTTLGMNILGRFLQNKASNIRFVGLAAIHGALNLHRDAVAKYLSTIMECLQSPDYIIKCCALDVACQLVQESNIDQLVKQFLSHWEKDTMHSDSQFSNLYISKLCNALELYAPNRRWLVNAVLETVTVAGNYIPLDVWRVFILMVSATPELQHEATLQFFRRAQNHPNQLSLQSMTLCFLGEYSETILGDDPDQDIRIITFVQNTCNAVMLDDFIESKKMNVLIGESTLCKSKPSSPKKRFIISLLITTVAKLSTRLPAKHLNTLCAILKRLSSYDAGIDAMQRSIEFCSILESKELAPFRPQIFESIPGLECQETDARNWKLAQLLKKPLTGDSSGIEDHEDSDLISTYVEDTLKRENPSVDEKAQIEELLADIFGRNDAIHVSKPPSAPSTSHDDNLNSLLDTL